jgi:hypothetical protein
MVIELTGALAPFEHLTFKLHRVLHFCYYGECRYGKCHFAERRGAFTNCFDESLRKSWNFFIDYKKNLRSYFYYCVIS